MRAYKDLVAVVVTAYNYGHFLHDCISSIASQSYSKIECIIVDDGSEDNTRQVVGDSLEKFPTLHTRYVRQEHSGDPSVGRNLGISLTQADYIISLDADDMLSNDYIASCVEILSKTADKSIAFTDIQMFGLRSDTIIGINFLPTEIRYKNFIPCAAVFRRKAWCDAGGYRIGFPGYEDWEYWIRCGAAKHFAVYVPGPKMHYRKHEGGLYKQHSAHDLQIKAAIVLANAALYNQHEIDWAIRVTDGFTEEADLLAPLGHIPCWNETEGWL
jgi:glycosyltransferase involved in cell wall biosynthesis